MLIRNLFGRDITRSINGVVILDPVSAFGGDINDNSNTEVRGLLAKLSKCAADHEVAIIAVSHLRKGEGQAIYRTVGSIAWVAAARAAYVVAKDKDDPDRRYFLPIKNNNGDDVTGFWYRLKHATIPGGIDTCIVEWCETPVEIDADELLAPARQPRDGASDEAREWLASELANGPVCSVELKRRAEAAGISERTLYRAKKALGIECGPTGFGGAWSWWLKADRSQSPTPPTAT